MLSYEDLYHLIGQMTPEQRRMTVTVSEGCDANGEAEFFGIEEMVVTGDGSIDAAADGVLDDGHPVLIQVSDHEDF